MKQLLKLIGTAFQWLIIAIILLLIAPLIIVVLICFGLGAVYGKMWSLIRHDPKKDITIKKLEDDAWPSAKTKDDFVKAFKNISDKLAKLADASQGDIEYEGFEVFETPSEITESAVLELAQTLTTEHAEIRLSLACEVVSHSDNQELCVYMEDGDEQAGTPFPPVYVEVLKPNYHVKRAFTVSDSSSAWVVISILRGKVKFTHVRGQLWAYVPERDVWLVQYKNNGATYGMRKNFTNIVAHEYWVDKN